MSRVTIAEFLDKSFDTHLDNESIPAFLGLTRKKAGDCLEAMLEYLQRKGDFRVPDRVSHQTRPFIWHEFSEAGRYGGDAIVRGHEVQTEEGEQDVFESRTAALRSMLLLHHQVVLCDPFHFLFSALCHSGGYSHRYESFIRFVAQHRQLIDSGILIFVSDKRCYDEAPVNHWTEMQRFALPELLAEVERREAAADGRNVETVTDLVPRTLAYMTLADRYDADVFFDHEMAGRTLRHIYDAWGDNEAVAKAETTINAVARDLTPNDIVNIRLTSEAFDAWRKTFSLALASESPSEFRATIENALAKLQKSEAKVLTGVRVKLLLGATAVALGTAAGLLAGPLGAVAAAGAAKVAAVVGATGTTAAAVVSAAAAGTALDLTKDRIKDALKHKLTEPRTLATAAADSHMRALLRTHITGMVSEDESDRPVKIFGRTV